MQLRPANTEDLPVLQELFTQTITVVCRNDYNSNQLAVWSSGAQNTARWQEILQQQFVQVAEVDGVVAGFATLANGTELDLLYVHKDYQRMGIASRLLAAIEAAARRQKQPVLTAAVSITARPFFVKMGFRELYKQAVRLQGIELVNFRMEKQLNPAVS